MKDICGLLLLKFKGGYYTQNIERAKVLLFSISFFWTDPEPFEIFICIPGEELDEAKSRIPSYKNLILHFVDENVVVPEVTKLQANGWLKQQILKLAAFNILESKFFITLDPDVICCKEISREIFLPRGRALSQWEYRTCHPNWWLASSRLLGMEATQTQMGLGVTPNILVTDVCRSLAGHLNTRSAENWWNYLTSKEMLSAAPLGNSWTEYTLYNVFLENCGILSQYHWQFMECGGMMLHSSPSVWRPHEFENWNPDDAFSGKKPGYFLICQSSTEISVDKIWHKIGKYFPS